MPKSHVSADQPIHGPAGGEFTQNHVDCGLLVVGFLVREAGAELVVGPVLHAQAWRLPQLPLGCDLDQLIGDLANTALHARLARLPSPAAKTVEIDVRLFRAVAGQQFDVLNRQEQLVAAGIVDFETIVRCAGGFDRAQAYEAADPMIDMDDQVPGREARHLGDEVLRPVRATPRAHQAVAQNILLADDGGFEGLEAALEPEYCERDLRLGQGQRFLP